MQATVADVMSTDVATISPGTSFREAVQQLYARRLHALPVVDDSGRVLGMLAESDLLAKEEVLAEPEHLVTVPLVGRRERRKAAARTVGEAMTSPAVTVHADVTVAEAARILHRRKVGRLPVVDDIGRLVGIVSRSDLLSVFLRSDEQIRADVERALAEMGPGVARRVTFTVTGGVVSVGGELELQSQANAALRVVRSVDGVCGLESRLRARYDDVGVGMIGP